MARPSTYSPEIASAICDEIMNGEALSDICRKEGMPDRTTVCRWIAKYEDFASRMAHAREEQAEALDERIQEVINRTQNLDIPPDAARVVINGLQWRAAKLKPKRYGDKVTLAGDAENPLNLLATRLDSAVQRKSMIDVTPSAKAIAAPDDGSDLL